MLQLIAIGITVFTGVVGAASVVNAVRVKENQGADQQRDARAGAAARPAQTA